MSHLVELCQVAAIARPPIDRGQRNWQAGVPHPVDLGPADNNFTWYEFAEHTRDPAAPTRRSKPISQAT